MDKARELRKRGYSYSEIAIKIGKSKRFAWKHAKNVSFTKRGFKRYTKSVTGILKQIKYQLPKLTPQKTRIIGHVLFDGALFRINYHRVVRYVNSSKKLIDQFIKDIKEVYGLVPSSLETIRKSSLTIYKVTFISKLLFDDLRKYFSSYSTKNVSPIPNEIMNSSKDIKLEFLRAFWEDEGSITSTGRLMADQKSEIIIRQLIKLHRDFGLSLKLCTYKEPTGLMYKIYFSKNKETLQNFHNLRLFDKSIVTRGKNIGRKKVDVLKKFISNNGDSTIASRLDGH